MAKKKPSPTTLSRRLQQDLAEAERLLEDGRPEAARELLEDLDRRRPGLAPVLELLVNACYDLNDISAYEWAIYRLLKVERDNSDAHLALAGAHASNLRPMLAIKELEYFLRRWPDHQQAGEARQLLDKLRSGLLVEATRLQLTEDEAFDLGYQNDEVRFLLEHGQNAQGRQAAERLLKRYPDFVPAQNNLSQLYAQAGELQTAIDLAHKVLDNEPDNVHALSNLTRLLFLSGQPEAAGEIAIRLKSSTSEAVDTLAKKAEALAYLGDDAGILELLRQAGARGDLDLADPSGLFRHLAAVAYYNQGRLKDARRLWKQALKTNPGMRLARLQLDDLEHPAGQRHGAYAFPFQNWVSEHTIRSLDRSLKSVSRRKNDSDGQISARAFLEQHPELLVLAPHLLQRGDESAGQFVIHLAGLSDHPELLQAVKDFALGQRGFDQLRMKAAQLASQHGLLPSGPVRLWSLGEWRDVMLLNFEITDEPEATSLSPGAQKLYEQAHDCLLKSEGAKAQALLEQVVALAPDEPSVRNNLAAALEIQGQTEQAHAMLKELHTRFPEYFFGVCGVARLEIAAGNTELARQMLTPLLQRQRLHITEFNSLCTAEIELSLAEKNEEAARMWLDMWERVDDENPQIWSYRLRLGKDLPAKVVRRLFGK
jgi:tetratricopeptide (TPR) repeat protein